jgi:hypothetical protein
LNDKSCSYINTCVSSIHRYTLPFMHTQPTVWFACCYHHYSTNGRANNGATTTARTHGWQSSNCIRSAICDICLFHLSHKPLCACMGAYCASVYYYFDVPKKKKKKKFNQLHTLHSTRANKKSWLQYYFKVLSFVCLELFDFFSIFLGNCLS